MNALPFLLMSLVMHTKMNNWLFACVMSIKKGEPVERFLGLVHVEDTTTLTLKKQFSPCLSNINCLYPRYVVKGTMELVI